MEGSSFAAISRSLAERLAIPKGDPRAATADKGRRLMDALVERFATFLTELAAAPVDESFPYGPRPEG